MSYEVIAIPEFRKELKKLVKKIPSLKTEFLQLITKLSSDATQGIPLGNNCFKIRIAIASKGKGKSGGARIITYVKVSSTTIYLLTIYDKSERDSVSDKDLKDLLINL